MHNKPHTEEAKRRIGEANRKPDITFRDVADLIRKGYLIGEALQELGVSQAVYLRCIPGARRKDLLFMRTKKAIKRVYSVPHKYPRREKNGNKGKEKYLFGAF